MPVGGGCGVLTTSLSRWHYYENICVNHGFNLDQTYSPPPKVWNGAGGFSASLGCHWTDNDYTLISPGPCACPGEATYGTSAGACGHNGWNCATTIDVFNTPTPAESIYGPVPDSLFSDMDELYQLLGRGEECLANDPSLKRKHALASVIAGDCLTGMMQGNKPFIRGIGQRICGLDMNVWLTGIGRDKYYNVQCLCATNQDKRIYRARSKLLEMTKITPDMDKSILNALNNFDGQSLTDATHMLMTTVHLLEAASVVVDGLSTFGVGAFIITSAMTAYEMSDAFDSGASEGLLVLDLCRNIYNLGVWKVKMMYDTIYYQQQSLALTCMNCLSPSPFHPITNLVYPTYMPPIRRFP